MNAAKCRYVISLMDLKFRDYESFRRAKVAFDTIEWDDGVDLDPEFVYEKSTPIENA